MDKIFLFFVILLVLGVVTVSGCTSPTQTTVNTVNIQNMAFNPSTLNVKVGTTVTSINKDSTAHDVVSDTGLFNSGNLNNGTKLQLYFQSGRQFSIPLWYTSFHDGYHSCFNNNACYAAIIRAVLVDHQLDIEKIHKFRNQTTGL